jgi:CIC family chloride channel protein
MHAAPPVGEPTPLRSAPPAELARVLAALVVVSVGAASFAMAFRAGIQQLYLSLFHAHDVLEVFTRLPWPARVAFPTLGALLAGLVGMIAVRSPVHGVGDVMEAVVLGRTRLSLRATWWKALGSWLAIGTGNSVGREGPLIQFGGSLGAAVATTARIHGDSARALIAAGTAAGFAAAYNTPFAAILFVVEIVTGVVVVDALGLVLIATVISTALVRASVGGGPIYGQRAFSATSARELVAYALLGLFAALVGQGFMRLLATGEASFVRSRLPQPWRAALGGVIVGTMALVWPEVTGNGYEPLNLLLDEHYSIGLVVVLMLAKALATTASVSSGSPGGVFTPSLFVGGALGLVYGHLVAGYVGAPGSEGGYALVGMAAMIAATTRAPLMASVLVFELSGDYAIVLPLVLATAFATILSRRLSVDSIYAAELRRRGVSWEVTLEGRKVSEPSPPS